MNRRLLSTSDRIVLVVEDESLIRSLLVEDLENAGFEVFEAKDADDAMILIAAHPGISAVVTDVSMPGSIDGIGLAGWMDTAAPGIPIVIASGFNQISDPETINSAIVGVVGKPYPVQKVINLLRTPR